MFSHTVGSHLLALLPCPWRCFGMLRLPAPAVEPTLSVGSKLNHVTQKQTPQSERTEALCFGFGSRIYRIEALPLTLPLRAIALGPNGRFNRTTAVIKTQKTRHKGGSLRLVAGVGLVSSGLRPLLVIPLRFACSI